MEVDSHMSFRSELQYQNTQSNYKRLINNYSASRVVSYNDIMRIALIKLQVLIPDKFYNIVELIFSKLCKLHNIKNISYESLINNKSTIKYYFIYLPNIAKNVNLPTAQLFYL